VFRVLAGFGLVLIVAALGSIGVGGALLIVPVRFTRMLNDAYNLPEVKPGFRLSAVVVRLLGLGLILCGCLVAWNAYRAA
jgi:hypothetical protein